MFFQEILPFFLVCYEKYVVFVLERLFAMYSFVTNMQYLHLTANSSNFSTFQKTNLIFVNFGWHVDFISLSQDIQFFIFQLTHSTLHFSPDTDNICIFHLIHPTSSFSQNITFVYLYSNTLNFCILHTKKSFSWHNQPLHLSVNPVIMPNLSTL